MTLTPNVARFLADLLARQTIQIGAPDFDKTVMVVSQARRELAAILETESDTDG